MDRGRSYTMSGALPLSLHDVENYLKFFPSIEPVELAVTILLIDDLVRRGSNPKS